MHLRPGVPVLIREDGAVQIGTVRPMVMSPATPNAARFLAGLEGRLADLTTRELSEFADLVTALVDRGALVPRRAPSSRRGHAVVRINGVDALGVHVASGLAAAGIGALSLNDARTVTDDSPFGPSAIGLTFATAAAMLVQRATPHVRLIGADQTATVEVLRSHGSLPITDSRRLMASDTRHLAITTDEDGVSVGPMVIPGATACVTCIGLNLTETDPCWPRLALQMGPWRTAGLVVPPDAAFLAAGIALREILGAIDDAPPSRVRWRIPFGPSGVTSVAVPPHPSCGCGGDEGHHERSGINVASLCI